MAEENWSHVDSTPLDDDDLPDTIKELTDVVAYWRNIGIHLGIRDSQLEVIQLQGHNPLDCMRQMLSTWLRRSYNVRRFGEPTWVKLVEAVSHSAGGGNPHLAMKIAKKHGDQFIGQCRIGFTQPRERRRQYVTVDGERRIRGLQRDKEVLQQRQQEDYEEQTDFQQQLYKKFNPPQQFRKLGVPPVSPGRCYATGKGLEVAILGETLLQLCMLWMKKTEDVIYHLNILIVSSCQ